MPPKPSKKRSTPFNQVIESLLDENQIFPALYLHQFSDLEGADFEALKAVWPRVNPDRRFALLEDLEKLAESETLVYFDKLAAFALDDEDPRVRRTAVSMLWESEDQRLATRFMKMVKQDPDAEVRSAAASALGKFVYMGELEEIPQALLHHVEDVLLETINGQDTLDVRRHALESMGFSGRPEVNGLIRQAYESDTRQWLISALFAMGRSADEKWGPDVLRMLGNANDEVQFEAVRAAGELELASARRPLLQLLDSDLQDEDVRRQVIWSLSKIGGEDVRETLEEMMEETEDDEELEFLEEALDNLEFTEEMALFDMFDLTDAETEEELEARLAAGDEDLVIEDDGLALEDDLIEEEKDEEDDEAEPGSHSTGPGHDLAPGKLSGKQRKRHSHKKS